MNSENTAARKDKVTKNSVKWTPVIKWLKQKRLQMLIGLMNPVSDKRS